MAGNCFCPIGSTRELIKIVRGRIENNTFQKKILSGWN